MLNFSVIVVGSLKKGPYFDLCQDFLNRMNWPVTIHEIVTKQKDEKKAASDEALKILNKLDNQAFTIILDERGHGLRSLDFASTLEKIQDTGEKNIQFVIGGATGLTDEVRDRASLLLSFGQQTWPHMLARVMLLEQIYRAQQILSGHPYHKE